MENNEEFVDMTENTEEQAVEENVVEETESIEPDKGEEIPVKTYTQEEFDSKLDELLAKKIARKEAKLRKEYEDKYSSYKEAERVLNVGLGTSNIEEATENLRNYYTEKGITIPDAKPVYDERVERLLAEDDARTIIDAGYEDIVEEVDRLANIGFNNMNQNEKIIFEKLASKRKEIEEERDIESLGVTKEDISKKEVVDYFNKLNPNLSLTEKWDMYLASKPKQEIESIGSLKETKPSEVKKYYTPEEARRLTEEDLDNPEIMAAVMDSMTHWEKQN